MLEKNVDMVLIGKNNLSILFSLQLLEMNKKVLLLDDNRFAYGPLYGNYVDLLQLEFYRHWGHGAKVESLKNIEQYCEPAPYYMYFDEFRLLLGRGFVENITELWRKLPSLFLDTKKDDLVEKLIEHEDLSSLEGEFYSYVSRIGQGLYRFKALESLNIEYYLNHCPKFLQELYEAFSYQIFESDNPKHRQLYYLTRSLSQQTLGQTSSEVEVFHLLLFLLSGQYNLKSEHLLEQLLEVYLDRGGQFKSTSIREWKFHNGRPWSVELASYEGIIHPKSIALFGGDMQGFPLKLKKPGEYYVGVQCNLPVDKKLIGNILPKRFMGCRRADMATQIPFWCCEYNEQTESLEIQVPYFFENGLKYTFLENELKQRLVRDFEFFFSLDLGDSFELDIVGFLGEVWANREHSRKFKKTTHYPLPSTMNLQDASNALSVSDLKGVLYFGPRQVTGLGCIGTLMQLKNVHSYI